MSSLLPAHATGHRPAVAAEPSGKIATTLLGEFAVNVNGVAIEAARWKHKHPRLLWQMLCLAPGHRLSRDEAVEALWPQAGVQASSNRLYHTLHTLRGIFSEAGLADARQLVQLQAGTLGLDARIELGIDAQRFAQAVAAARAGSGNDEAIEPLETARAELRGAFAVPVAAGEWFTPHRRALLRDQVWVLERLAQRYQQSGRVDDAVQASQALLQAEPSNEATHRRLIELYDAQNRPDLAAQQYTACSRYLRRDLGIEPSTATKQLALRVTRQAVSRRASQRTASAGVAAPARPRFVAPTRVTPLLGRQAELGELQAWLLRGDSRLITITAAGGVGKTRLAAMLAEQLQDHFADGVCFVALGDVQRPSRLAEHLCQALALSSAGKAADQVLAEHLGARHLLLVLDRFEHLLEAAPQLGQWLQAAPRLRVVVTSQCALQMRAERVYELQTLLAQAPQAAVELFVCTARHAGVQDDALRDLPAILRICERLAGNALAIELAAALLVRMTLAELPAALDKPLQVLGGQPSDDEPQHASLAATIAWSVSFLAPQEARLLSLLSVFAGDFSSDDAQAVLGPLLGDAALQPMLRTLLDRHLLYRRSHLPDAQPGRFAMADAVREHARHNAVSADGWPRAAEAHARHFAHAAAKAIELMQAGQHGASRSAHAAIAAELEGALLWHREHADKAGHLRVCWQAGCLMANFGVLRDAVDCLHAATAVDVDSRHERDQKAWCRCMLARTVGTLGDIPASVRALTAARQLAKGSQDQRLVNQIGAYSASTLYARLHLDQAIRIIDKLIRSTRHLDARQRPAGPHAILAACYIGKGDYARAAEVSDEALEDGLASSDLHSILQALLARAAADLGRGHLDRAQAAIDECRLLLESSASNTIELAVLMLEFFIAFERADHDQASAPLARVVALCRSTQPQRLIMAELALEFMLMESQRTAEATRLRQLTDDEFPFALYVTMHVSAHVYRLRLQALEGDWSGALKQLNRLQRLVRRSGNASWGSGVAQSAAVAAHRAGNTALAQRLLEQSRALLALRQITTTPRQQRAWSDTQALLDSTPQGAPDTAPHEMLAALERFAVELDRRCALLGAAGEAHTLGSKVGAPSSLVTA